MEHGNIILLSIIVKLGKHLHATQSAVDFTQYGPNKTTGEGRRGDFPFTLVSRSITTDISFIIYRTV